MYLVLFPVSIVYLWIARRAFVTHQLTGRRADLTVAVGLIWLGSSIVIYLLSDTWTLMFWAAHALEAIGFVAVAGSVAVDLARQVPSYHLYRRVEGSDLLESEESLLGGYVRSMTATMELRDPSTREHSRRVAALAVRVGMKMGLPAPALRRLAVAGLLHDIGKLQVPEQILNKPGRLTDEEFAVIKTHPRKGADLLAHLGGFERELPIVLWHHERFGGGGYPDGIAGQAIPLEARIMTVCDVYDALISRRAYREPWSHERAMAQIVSETATTFDPACVDALAAVLGAPASSRCRCCASRSAPSARPTPRPDLNHLASGLPDLLHPLQALQVEQVAGFAVGGGDSPWFSAAASTDLPSPDHGTAQAGPADRLQRDTGRPRPDSLRRRSGSRRRLRSAAHERERDLVGPRLDHRPIAVVAEAPAEGVK